MLAIRERARRGSGRVRARTSINNNHITCRLANLFGSPNVISVGYFCYGPRVAVCKVTAAGKHGGKLWDTVAISDFYSNPACIVEWGSQKRTSNDHGLIGHTPMTSRAQENPVSIIVDPRKPAAAGKGDIWLPLRPGTDAAMALGWMNVIIEEELYDKEFVESWCHGFEELQERVKEYPLDKVAEITWCNAERHRAAARLYARTKPATIAWGNGTDQLGVNTFQAMRALLILMGITGNLDVPGGNCFWPAPRLNYPELWDHLSPEQAAKRLGGDVQGAQSHALCLRAPADLFRTILSGKPYPVKALIVVGNNTATCYPNTPVVVEALRKLELLVVQDIFMTPTAEYADVVLPAAGNMERDEPRLHMHIKGPGGMFMDTSRARSCSRRAPLGLGIHRRSRPGARLRDYFPSVEEFANEALKPMGMTWDELKQHDYVVEPMRYRKYEQDGFGTPTGKFEIWSTMMEEWGTTRCRRMSSRNESPVSIARCLKEYPLILNTGVKQPMYWHSMGRQVPSLRRLQPEPLLEINPETAAEIRAGRQGVTPGSRRVRGKLRMRVNCSPRPTLRSRRCRTAGGCPNGPDRTMEFSRSAPTC